MNYLIEFSPCIFGDDIQIELKLKGLERPLIGSTFFSTPAKEGYSIDINILFKNGSAEVDKNLYSSELNQVYTLLNYRKDINILIEGHTDKVGTEKSNINLSRKRAESVKKYLISQGISDKRIKTIGYGWSSPAYPYLEGQKANELNRRIEIKIVN
jgi:outer membrane protein OmpA-like peptidoglycan-associated protein